MVGDPTFSVNSAQTRAGVDTLEISAGFVGGTLWVDGALRPAGDVGITEVARHTLTGCSSALCVANGIFSTR